MISVYKGKISNFLFRKIFKIVKFLKGIHTHTWVFFPTQKVLWKVVFPYIHHLLKTSAGAV